MTAEGGGHRHATTAVQLLVSIKTRLGLELAGLTNRVRLQTAGQLQQRTTTDIVEQVRDPESDISGPRRAQGRKPFVKGHLGLVPLSTGIKGIPTTNNIASHTGHRGNPFQDPNRARLHSAT